MNPPSPTVLKYVFVCDNHAYIWGAEREGGGDSYLSFSACMCVVRPSVRIAHTPCPRSELVALPHHILSAVFCRDVVSVRRGGGDGGPVLFTHTGPRFPLWLLGEGWKIRGRLCLGGQGAQSLRPLYRAVPLFFWSEPWPFLVCPFEGVSYFGCCA